MTAGALTQVRQCRAQLRRGPPGPDVLTIDPVAFKQFKRHEELTARGMEGKRLEQSGNGMSKPGVMAERVDIGFPGAVQNFRGKGNEIGGRVVGIPFEVDERRHRLVVEIESARRDSRLQSLRR